MNEQESAIRSDQIEFMVSRNQSALRKLIWSGLCRQGSLFKVLVNGLTAGVGTSLRVLDLQASWITSCLPVIRPERLNTP